MKRPEENDYTSEDGTIDHQKRTQLYTEYKQWMVDTGKICSLCHGYVACLDDSGPRLCYDCKDISRPEELCHDSRVRCPKCGYNWDVDDGDSYALMSDGDHIVWCDECGHKFCIVTNVSYSFISPPRENIIDLPDEEE